MQHRFGELKLGKKNKTLSSEVSTKYESSICANFINVKIKIPASALLQKIQFFSFFSNIELSLFVETSDNNFFFTEF